MIAVQWCIPDVPSELKDQIKREAYLTNELIIQYEMQQAKQPCKFWIIYSKYYSEQKKLILLENYKII